MRASAPASRGSARSPRASRGAHGLFVLARREQRAQSPEPARALGAQRERSLERVQRRGRIARALVQAAGFEEQELLEIAGGRAQRCTQQAAGRGWGLPGLELEPCAEQVDGQARVDGGAAAVPGSCVERPAQAAEHRAVGLASGRVELAIAACASARSAAESGSWPPTS